MDDIFNSLSTYGYIIVFLYSFGGGFLALLAASVLSYAGEMNLYLTLIVAFVANMLGDGVLFWMARNQMGDLSQHMKKYSRQLALTRLLMKKYGSLVIFIQKYIYGVKTLIPIAMGLTKYDFKTFLFFNIFASLLWTLIVGIGGYLSGEFFINLFQKAKEYPYLAPIILLGILGLIYFYFKFFTRKKKRV
jgi:membrane protein DedA with SNARE-associated domain